MTVQVEQLITEHLDLWTQAQTAKSTSGRGSNNKIELTGIKKLRELILELAVRGKLVPQDPNDEPASELLKRISAEKEALVKAGKLKKQKPLPPITDEEKPFEPPSGWQFVKLHQISVINGGFAFKSTNYSSEGARVIRISDFDDQGLKSESIVKHEYSSVLEPFKLQENTILMAMTGGTVGKAFLVKKVDELMVVNQRVASIKIDGGLLPEFVSAVIKTPLVQNIINEAKNSTNDNISMGDIQGFIIPIPPKCEQIRIVSRLHELMALCDQLEQQSYQQLDAHNQIVDALLATLTQSQNADELASNWQRLAAHFDTLFTTEYSIDALKQTILQLAVMGKLVKQNPNDEPASELLKRIAAEKDALVKAGKIKKQKPLPPISDDEKPFELPEGWEWCRLGWIAEINPRNYAEDSVKASFVPMASIGKSHTGEHLTETRDWGDIKKGFTHFANGDLGIAKITPCFENSKAAVFDGLTNGIGAGTTELHIARFISPENTLAKYLLLNIKSPLYLKIGESKMTGTAGQKRLPKDFFEGNPFALPPISEQGRIVYRVNELFELCDALSEKLNSSKQIQVVLAEALVEQVVA
ncbi:hypothetical protein AEST_18220 [Alishewanella aestuarii B11]|uniref:Type I restriction modification DNA specificity domain-containing protein n=1 Tax=Alishewanella aestuarii B11 TaxID=1197174 RepID=J1Q320_9ALTE|nr:restriction endonuclease subunit S [Alishewanella aestuarii]EJI85483.1 hypothetical protein AEST_18220 [Alishewanella aestuarii B11]